VGLCEFFMLAHQIPCVSTRFSFCWHNWIMWCRFCRHTWNPDNYQAMLWAMAGKRKLHFSKTDARTHVVKCMHVLFL